MFKLKHIIRMYHLQYYLAPNSLGVLGYSDTRPGRYSMYLLHTVASSFNVMLGIIGSIIWYLLVCTGTGKVLYP
jgi:hypothetical protein